MSKRFMLIAVLSLIISSLDLALLNAEAIHTDSQMVLKYGMLDYNSEDFKLFKVYGDLETDDYQQWLDPYGGRCNKKCQDEFNKCVESQATKKSCDANLYKITGMIGYEFPCGENEIWLMQFSAACNMKGGSNKEYTGHVACIASDIAKRCEMAGDGCAVECKNSSAIDRNLGLYIPKATKKQHGIARPGLFSLDIRRE